MPDVQTFGSFEGFVFERAAACSFLGFDWLIEGLISCPNFPACRSWLICFPVLKYDKECLLNELLIAHIVCHQHHVILVLLSCHVL